MFLNQDRLKQKINHIWQTMKMQGKDDIAFEKQLNSFEAAMQNDLNHRNTEVAKKWEFDFGMN